MFFETDKDELIKETIRIHNNQSYDRSFFSFDKIIFLSTLLVSVIAILNPQDSFFKLSSIGYNACVFFIVFFGVSYFLLIPQKRIIEDCIKDHTTRKLKLHQPHYYLRSGEAIMYYILAALGFCFQYYMSASILLLFPIITFFFFREIQSRIVQGVFEHYQQNPIQTNPQNKNALVNKAT